MTDPQFGPARQRFSLTALASLLLGISVVLAAVLYPLPVGPLRCALILSACVVSSALVWISGMGPTTIGGSLRQWLVSWPGVAVFLSIIFVAYICISGWTNRWSADFGRSDYPDPESYFMEAKIMAGGHLSAPSSQASEYESTRYFFHAGRIYSKYPPGWPALLSLGITVRAPWIINPVFAALSLLALYYLGRKLYGAEVAWTAMALACAWPNFVWFSASYFSESSAILFTTLAITGLVGVRGTRPVASALLCGVSLGILSLIRPFTAVALAAPLVAFWLPMMRTRATVFAAACASAAVVLFAVLQLSYNFAQTGHILPFPFSLFNPSDSLGFGFHSTDVGLPVSYFGPTDAARFLIRLADHSNFSFMPFALFLILPIAWWRRKPGDLLLAACVLSIVLFYVPYYGNGIRYWLPATPAFALLAVRGAVETAGFLKRRFRAFRDAEPGRLCFSVLSPMALAAFVMTVVWLTGADRGHFVGGLV